MKKILFIISTSIMIFILNSCVNHQKEYNEVKAKNTIEAYSNFAKEFSDSDYADSAMQKVYAMEFKNINFINTVEGYEEFIIKYPSSNFADTAKAKIYKLAYDDTKNTNSVKAYTNFSEKYPDNPYKIEIDSIVKVLKYATSDKGIKTNVLRVLRTGISKDLKFCINKQTKIVIVNNGHVTVKMNCIKVAGCQENSNRSRFMRIYRQTQQWFSSRKSRIKALPGVKSVNLVDLGS